MKNLYAFYIAISIFFILNSACGESEVQKQARLQAYQDSLRLVEETKMAEKMAMIQDSTTTTQEIGSQIEKEETPIDPFNFDEDGKYIVQVGAWRSQEKADAFVNNWVSRNYPRVYVAQTGSELTGNIWFRVRIGNFSTMMDAESFGAMLAKEINSSYWVININ